jgi:uncharacterized protein YjbJ (UPF0337 family)
MAYDKAKPASRSQKMNWGQIESNWTEACKEIKVTWGKLTEDDLTAIAGRRDLLADLLHEKYGYAKVDVENKIDRFAQALHP